jgi:hypothetical protein
LEAKDFHILTDHKPLTYALHCVSEPWSARQPQQLFYLVEFMADIHHMASKDNVVVDALSRSATAEASYSQGQLQPRPSSLLNPPQTVAGLFQAETSHCQLHIN